MAGNAVQSASFTETYGFNPDGTFTVTAPGGSTLVGAVTDGGAALYSVQTGGGAIYTVEARLQ